jgi:hypothetical protein
MTTIRIHGVNSATITDRVGNTDSGNYRGTQIVIGGIGGTTELTLFSAETGDPLPIEDLRRFEDRVEAMAETTPKVDYALFAELVSTISELLEMANRHGCGECGGFLSSELDFVTVAETALSKAKAALGQ